MKIGILTLYYKNYNYGALLQSFSLVRVLKKMGVEAEQITYDHRFKSKLYFQFLEAKNSKGKEKCRKYWNVIKSISKYVVFPSVSTKLINRKRRINRFLLSIPHSQQKYDEKTIIESNDKYDKIICGSDIIWVMNSNPYLSALGFVSKGKKFSYAASMGAATVSDEWVERFTPWLWELNSISMRETGVVSQLNHSFPDKKVCAVLDPTLLLRRDEWDSLLSEGSIDSDYCLIYILSEDARQQKAAIEFTHSNNLKALTFPNIHNYIYYNQRQYGDIQDYSSDPLDFVRMIKNAKVVITDSFHAVLFSVIYHIPFWALKRDSEPQFVGRVESFLNDIDLQKQIANYEDLPSLVTPMVDFAPADSYIDKMREVSISYLKENLNEE
ncbi:MAG: polysaccharide pyruvyl transferase family protein [Lachnospiraceae bacterium]|nr:polysaccharide pyruvyl transferase family protein [Lachnospiraceae bacterium]